MHTVGSYEAKTHLPRLLDEVAQGQTVVITRRGVPIAKMVPITEERRRDKRAAVEALKEYRRTAPSLGGLSIKKLIDDGRL